MDNLKEYEKVAKFYERADKIYNRLVKAMLSTENRPKLVTLRALQDQLTS